MMYEIQTSDGVILIIESAKNLYFSYNQPQETVRRIEKVIQNMAVNSRYRYCQIITLDNPSFGNSILPLYRRQFLTQCQFERVTPEPEKLDIFRGYFKLDMRTPRC